MTTHVARHLDRPMPQGRQLKILFTRHKRPGTPHILMDMPAFLKLTYMLHAGPTEVAGFAVTEPDDPLHITEFHTIKQVSSPGFCDMDGKDMVAHAMRMDVGTFTPIEGGNEWVGGRGISSENCMKIWVHTHPGRGPTPSSFDETTAQTTFAAYDWFVMLIMDREQGVYARLQHQRGPYAEQEMDVYLNMAGWPEYVEKHMGDFAQEAALWPKEYKDNVTVRGVNLPHVPRSLTSTLTGMVKTIDFSDPRYEGWNKQPIPSIDEGLVTEAIASLEQEETAPIGREDAQEIMLGEEHTLSTDAPWEDVVISDPFEADLLSATGYTDEESSPSEGEIPTPSMSVPNQG